MSVFLHNIDVSFFSGGQDLTVSQQEAVLGEYQHFFFTPLKDLRRQAITLTLPAILPGDCSCVRGQLRTLGCLHSVTVALIKLGK